MTMDALVERMPAAIGRRVRESRTARGMTLDQLAARSGVSRRMIVNVESGSANASIATLLRLATALEIPLAHLVEGSPSTEPFAATTPADRAALWQGPSGGTAVLIASSGTLELWEWRLQPGETYESDAHRPGTRELLHVHTGRLRLTLDSDVHDLGPGCGASFAADVPHRYACSGPRPVRFSMTVLEPSTFTALTSPSDSTAPMPAGRSPRR